MNLRGRRKITSSETQESITDLNILVKVVNGAMSTHLVNAGEIRYLIDYKNGRQPILGKTKEIRPEINNKLVINHAQMITRNIVGYFLGTPIQYVQASADKKEQLERLNKIVSYEDKASVDMEIAEYQSICGTAYRIIYTDGIYGDEVPFEDKSLDPTSTFVVYESTIAEKPLIGVTYVDIVGYAGEIIGRRFYVYTAYGLYVFEGNGESINLNTFSQAFEPYSVGGVPIIEYPNNVWRISDWELCIGLCDAINSLQSGRLDDIDQTVQSLLIFLNADIDETTYSEMRSAGIVCLKEVGNGKPDVKSIVNTLDHNGMNMYAEELEQLLYALIGIPDRNNRSGGGGDTGTAVELRDGWADLEIVARNKEHTFKRSEKQALKIILTIMNNTEKLDLSLLDINIKFSRNKNNNLLVKTQAYMNLITTKTLDPADCLTIVDLVSDVNDYVDRGKKFWGDAFAGKVSDEPTTDTVSTEQVSE